MFLSLFGIGSFFIDYPLTFGMGLLIYYLLFHNSSSALRASRALGKSGFRASSGFRGYSFNKQMRTAYVTRISAYVTYCIISIIISMHLRYRNDLLLYKYSLALGAMCSCGKTCILTIGRNLFINNNSMFCFGDSILCYDNLTTFSAFLTISKTF